ncbi:uncharacterized protein LOC131642183 [Vicia villosa]|uniref:uncharacterized protein LOC131642183 n=1 Tax=Vicia villosa TaxID=3911 RepID=UPI00273BE70C|nr:uncharacterized protein LOC131642183 [Vicia villosa]
MIAGVLGGNPNGARISANRQLGEFQWNNLPLLKGTHDPEDAQKWMKEIERIFRVIDCAENVKVRDELDVDGVEITWAVFRREFLRRYFPEDVRGRKEIEFLELKQGSVTVPEYASKFVELAKYYSHYNNEEASEFSNRIFEEDNIKLKLSHSRELVDKKGNKPMDRGKPYGKGNLKASGWERPSGGESSAPVRCYRCGEAGHRIHECKSEEKKCYRGGHISPQCTKPRKNQSGGKVFALSGSEITPEDRLTKAVGVEDLAMIARQVSEAVKDGAAVFMLFASMEVKGKSVSSELPVVRDFPEVFPEDVRELPPEREK